MEFQKPTMFALFPARALRDPELVLCRGAIPLLASLLPATFGNETIDTYSNQLAKEFYCSNKNIRIAIRLLEEKGYIALEIVNELPVEMIDDSVIEHYIISNPKVG